MKSSQCSSICLLLACLLGKNPLSKGLDFQKTLSTCLQNSSSVRISADALQIMSHFLQNLATNIPTFALIFLRESDLNVISFIQTANERKRCLWLYRSLLRCFLPFISQCEIYSCLVFGDGDAKSLKSFQQSTGWGRLRLEKNQVSYNRVESEMSSGLWTGKASQKAGAVLRVTWQSLDPDTHRLQQELALTEAPREEWCSQQSFP